MTNKSDLKPYQAALIVAFFSAVFLSVFLLLDKQGQLKSASFLHYQDGTLNVLLDNTIHRYSDQGDYSRISLESLGIDTFIGGFSFFPNGDLLISPQRKEPGLIKKLLVFFRLSSQALSKHEGSSLIRCDLNLGECRAAVKSNEAEFDRTYRSFVLDDESLLISDTSNHRLVSFDKNGELVKQSSKGFKFPNKIQVINDKILVANTNHNAISVADYHGVVGLPSQDAWEHWSLKTGASGDNGHIFPTEFVKLEKGLAVLSHGNSLARGSLYLMNASGEVVSEFSMPADADLISIALYRGEVVASDFSSYKIYRFSSHGRLLGELELPELETALSARKSEYEKYDQYLFYLLLVAGVVFVLFFVLGAWLELARQKHRKEELEKISQEDLEDHPKPDFDSSQVKWLKHRVNKFQDSKVLQWLLNLTLVLGAVAVCFSIFAMEDSELKKELIFKSAGMFVLFVFIIWQAKKQLKPELGVLGQWVLLKDNKGRKSIQKANEIKYRGEIIILEEAYLILQNGQTPYFEKDEVDKYLKPRLALAQKLSWAELIAIMWRMKDKHFLSSMLVLTVLLIALLVMAAK